MKWYPVAVKRIVKGIVSFLLPFMLIIFLFGKAIALVKGLIEPLNSIRRDERLLSNGMLTLLSILVILLICYLAGWRSEQKNIKSLIPLFEEYVLVFIPGYTLWKSRTDVTLRATDGSWKSVLVGENGDWKFGIEVEQHQDGYSTIFFPEPPDAKSGEIKLISSSKLKRINIPASKLVTITRNYGDGSATLTDQLKSK